jgi:hypothetical protein
VGLDIKINMIANWNEIQTYSRETHRKYFCSSNEKSAIVIVLAALIAERAEGGG